MDIKNKYRFYVGTSRGAVVCTQCNSEDTPQYKLTPKSSEVTSLGWGRSDAEIIVGYDNGLVNLYDADQEKFVKVIKKLEGKGAVIGASPIDDAIVIGRRDGAINLWTKSDTESFTLNLPETGTLEAMEVHKNRFNFVGTGGESNDFKLWDVESKRCVFKAKSMGHDELNLPIPTSVRGICFLEDVSCCATKEGHILLYDDRAQRRPVVKFLEPKASYTVLTAAHGERQCLAGTTRGYMQLIDMKAPGKCLRTFKGFTGSVTDIVCDPNNQIVATTCLDRHFRVHDLNSKELLYKEYMKQNLTKVLFKELIKEEAPENDGQNAEKGQEEDEEYEAMFKSMEEISDGKSGKKKSSKKRKTSAAEGKGRSSVKKKKLLVR